MDVDAALAAVATCAEAVRSPDGWQAVAVATSGALGADTGSLGFYSADGGSRVRACPNTDPHWHLSYDAEMHAANYVWAMAARQPAGRAFSEAHFGGRERYLGSDIFNGFIRPQGMESILTLTLTGPSARSCGLITLGRRAGREPFGPGDIAGAVALVEALSRTILAVAPAGPVAEAPAAAEVELLVTPEGRLLRHPPGLAALIRGGVIVLAGGCIEMPGLPGLAAALREVGRSPGGWPPPVPMRIGPVPSPLGPLHVGLVPGGSSAPGAVRMRLAVEPDLPPLDRLQREFELTARERELAALIAEGWSLPEAAEAMQISLNTARSHLQNLFDKFDSRSQLRLARRLGRAP